MEKLTFFLTVTLIALQGSFTTGNELEDLLAELNNEATEIDKVISYINENLMSLLRDYNIEIGSTISKNDLFIPFEQLQQSISVIESKIPAGSKHCIDKAWRMVMLTSSELERGVDQCLSDSKIKVNKMENVVQNLSRKAANLQARILIDMWKCINNDDLQCLRDLVAAQKQELEECKKEVEDVKEVVDELVNNGIKGLNVCLEQVKEDLVLKSETILAALNKCIQQTPVSTKVTPAGIWDIINELKKKIEGIIETVTNLPAIILDKIQELIGKLNIAVIAKQLENEINLTINDGGRNAEKCRPKAEDSLHTLVESSQKEAKGCLESAEDEVAEINSQVATLIDEAKNLLINVNKDVFKCQKDNILNPIGLVNCIKSLYEEYKEKVTNIQTQVTEAVESITQQAEKIVKTAADCVNKIQISFIEDGQKIVKDVEQCVLTAY